MKTINPATDQVIGDYPPDSAEQIESKLSACATAFASWRNLSIKNRCAFLARLAGILRSRKSDLARLAAEEMGKPINAGETEVSKCAVACEHFAANAAVLLVNRDLAGGGGHGYCRFDPLGPILAIMPWNFPYWQVFRFAAAALAAGNTIALKHAPNVPGCALALQAAFAEAGFPAGTFVSVRIDDNAMAQKLCAHPFFAGVTVTGSERAGMAVAQTAGGALKKTVMELGGSDPFIVLKDADLEFAAAEAAEARCMNTGQSCICAKRFIVEESVRDRFQAALAEQMLKFKPGDPLSRSTNLGPLARMDLLTGLQKQVDESVSKGAQLVMGGQRSGSVGCFYPPTILRNVQPGMAAFDEETFGPVAAVVSAAGGNEAIELANKSRFGLGASIWTRDLELAERMAAKIDAGNVFINSIVRSDPRLPFGGVKNSGWGRELSEVGLKEFTNTKTVWVSKA